MPSAEHQRWARCPAHLAWKRPGVPAEWTRVLDRHPYPDGLSYDGYPMPGFVWLDTPGKVLHVPAGYLEFREG